MKVRIDLLLLGEKGKSEAKVGPYFLKNEGKGILVFSSQKTGGPGSNLMAYTLGTPLFSEHNSPMILHSLAASESEISGTFFFTTSSRHTSAMAFRADEAVLQDTCKLCHFTF